MRGPAAGQTPPAFPLKRSPRLAAGPGIANASLCASGRRITSDRFLTKERSMRKTLILTLVLSVFAVIAYAQTTGTAPAAPATGTSTTTSTTTSSTGAATTTTTKSTHHKKAAKSHSVKGTVASVDATAKSFAVHPAKGEDVTVKVNDKTKYSKGKTWDDVKADAKVTVSYHNDGTDNWALKVTFAAEPKAKAAKPAAAATGTGTGR
jgi:hypothetical protein